jgi:hypothetical protein
MQAQLTTSVATEREDRHSVEAARVGGCCTSASMRCGLAERVPPAFPRSLAAMSSCRAAANRPA